MNSKRLLVVDDDNAARRMMRRVLEREGYEVDEANNGASAVALVNEAAPDALLLDLRMPGELSGFDVAHQLKSSPKTNQLPIIVVSASTHFNAQEAVKQTGVDAFLEKPIDFDLLKDTLSKFLN